MNEIALGKTGLKIRRIGFGGIPIQRLSPEESDVILERAVEAGVNFFDTSRIYTDSEEKMGRVFPRYRDRIVIATKSFRRTAREVEEDIEISLKNLRTDYIDLYQIHNVTDESVIDKILGPGGALEGLTRAKEQGKIRFIGMTGHKPWLLTRLVDYFDTVQFPFNIIETGALAELLPKAKEKGLGTIAMKPVAGGALTNVALNLRYILQSGIDVAIPGIDRVDQVGENIGVLDNLRDLTDDEMALLEKEKEELGDEFCRRCEYCMPCPEGLNISFLHLIKAYYFRYGLKEWSLERLEALPKGYEDCIACGICIEKCPYDLNMPKIFRETWEKIQADSK